MLGAVQSTGNRILDILSDAEYQLFIVLRAFRMDCTVLSDDREMVNFTENSLPTIMKRVSDLRLYHQLWVSKIIAEIHLRSREPYDPFGPPVVMKRLGQTLLRERETIEELKAQVGTFGVSPSLSHPKSPTATVGISSKRVNVERKSSPKGLKVDSELPTETSSLKTKEEIFPIQSHRLFEDSYQRLHQMPFQSERPSPKASSMVGVLIDQSPLSSSPTLGVKSHWHLDADEISTGIIPTYETPSNDRAKFPTGHTTSSSTPDVLVPAAALQSPCEYSRIGDTFGLEQSSIECCCRRLYHLSSQSVPNNNVPFWEIQSRTKHPLHLFVHYDAMVSVSRSLILKQSDGPFLKLARSYSAPELRSVSRVQQWAAQQPGEVDLCLDPVFRQDDDRETIASSERLSGLLDIHLASCFSSLMRRHLFEKEETIFGHCNSRDPPLDQNTLKEFGISKKIFPTDESSNNAVLVAAEKTDLVRRTIEFMHRLISELLREWVILFKNNMMTYST